MIIAYYSRTTSIETKFLRLYEGETIEALYLDGSRKAVKIIGGKPFLAEAK